MGFKLSKSFSWSLARDSNPGGGVRPPTGYAFIIQNNKIVMLAGKPVLRKVS
ncbi:MAG: hypothetical protein JZU55_05855 [Afipia sp.]|nr:hypothetical protein [Afipia sp.]